MAKKIQPKTLGEAYKGTILTFIVTLFILGVGFFLPMISAKEIQDAREGKGRYTPEEKMFWDFQSDGDFVDVEYSQYADDGGNSFLGISRTHEFEGRLGSVYWNYHGALEQPSFSWRQAVTVQDPTIVDSETELPVVDSYGMLSLEGSNRHNNYGIAVTPQLRPEFKPEWISFHFDISSKDLVNNDATRIDFMIHFQSTVITDEYIEVLYRNGRHNQNVILYSDRGWENGEILSVDISLLQLIEIYTKSATSESPEDAKEYIRVKVWADNTVQYSSMGQFSTITFDMQVYGLKGSPNAMTLLSVWYVVQSILIFMLGIVMIPQISIGGLSKLLRLNKEW